MIRGFDKPDEEIQKLLTRFGCSEEAEAALRCDMSISQSYGVVWLFAYKERFVVINVEDESFKSYTYNSLDEIKTEDFINSGEIIIKKSGVEYPIAAYTNTAARNAGRFCIVLNKLKEQKVLTDEDFKSFGDDTVCPTCGKPYKDQKRKICPDCMNRKAIIFRMLGYLPKYAFPMCLLGACMLMVTLAGVLKPYVSGATFYDEVLTEGGKYYGHVLEIVLALMGLEIGKLLFQILQGFVKANLSAKIVFDIKTEVFGAMQNLSMSFFNSKHTGSLMNRIGSDADDMRYFLMDGMPSLIVNACTLIGSSAVMISINPLLSIIVFLPVPFVVYMVRRVFPKFRKYKNATWLKRSSLNSIINDALSGVRVVKAFGKEKSEIDRFDEASSALYDAQVREGVQSAKTFPIMGYITQIGGLFVWAVGGAQVISGEHMTFGMLMTFVGYMSMVIGPVDSILRSMDWMTDSLNGAYRIFEIIDRKSDVLPPKKPVKMPKIKGHIELKNVTFAYEPNKDVLHNINLDIKAGEMIGLVGHSGAGKSTITNIITRLYDVNEGEIKIDGVNVKDIEPSDLHKSIGMVLQETHLFSGSIKENIAFARPDATDEEIIAAARMAYAHDFIVKLPDGYDTVLGRRGTNLSGGERQRINIARAILLNPSILILDEATASVDTETELQIQQAINTLTSGRTTIAIAHRLSTLKNASRLVVVEQGEIAEIGTHEELENKGGIYSDMLGKQKEALKIRGFDDEK